jgi:hypothetical protein
VSEPHSAEIDESGIVTGMLRALRGRAAARREMATSGTAPGESGVTLFSPEARVSLALAALIDGIADEIEAGAPS